MLPGLGSDNAGGLPLQVGTSYLHQRASIFCAVICLIGRLLVQALQVGPPKVTHLQG